MRGIILDKAHIAKALDIGDEQLDIMIRFPIVLPASPRFLATVAVRCICLIDHVLTTPIKSIACRRGPGLVRRVAAMEVTKHRILVRADHTGCPEFLEAGNDPSVAATSV
jgi:hypothetical protein